MIFFCRLSNSPTALFCTWLQYAASLRMWEEIRERIFQSAAEAAAKAEMLASKRTLATMSMYQSPYASRSGGGFPIFTEERIMDRKVS